MRRITSLAFISVLLIVDRIGAAEQGKKLAVVVGVREYQHARFSLPKYTENAALETAQVLREAGYEVTLLCDSNGKKDADLKPTRANILQHVERTLSGRHRDDLVLIALAGHGLQPDRKNESYFCPADADPADRETMIGTSKFIELMKRSGAGIRLMLIDACRDAPELKLLGINEDNVPKPPDGSAILFSCKPGEVAYELDKYRHTVFFHFVIKGLRGAAADQRGNVTWGSLVEYVTREVSEDVPKTIKEGAKQSPNENKNIAGSIVLLKASPKLVRNDPITEIVPPKPRTDPGLPIAKDLVGVWTSSGPTFHIKADGTFLLVKDDLYLPGRYTLVSGTLQIRWAEISWHWRGTVAWEDAEKTRLRVSVQESNLPGPSSVGKQFTWQRADKAEPPPPPAAKDLVGTSWATNTGATFYIRDGANLQVQLTGQTIRAHYEQCGSVIAVAYPDRKWTELAMLSWTDEARTRFRSNIIYSTIPGASPGEQIAFRRVK